MPPNQQNGISPLKESVAATFSCGVGDVLRFGDATNLGDAADKALYEAKRASHNRVVLAQG